MAMSKATRDERMKEREKKKAKVDEQHDSDDVRFFESMFNIFIIQLKYAQFSFGCNIRSGYCYMRRRGR